MSDFVKNISQWVYYAEPGTEKLYQYETAKIRKDAPKAAVQAFEAWKEKMQQRNKNGKKYICIYDKPFHERTLEEEVCWNLNAYGNVRTILIRLLQKEREKLKGGASQTVEHYFDEMLSEL